MRRYKLKENNSIINGSIITNDKIKSMVKGILANYFNGLPENPFYRLLLITDLMKKVTNHDLLHGISNLFVSLGLCSKATYLGFVEDFEKMVTDAILPQSLWFRATAIGHSDFFTYLLLTRNLENNPPFNEIPLFQYYIEDTFLFTNIDLLENQHRDKNFTDFVKNAPYTEVRAMANIINEDIYTKSGHGLFSKRDLKFLKNHLELSTTDDEKSKSHVSAKKNVLSKIWLPEPKITIEQFFDLGIEKGIWSDNLEIIVTRGNIYGSGKALLGNLSIMLKGYSISSNIDHKTIGKAFCQAFNIPISKNTTQPYKAFSTGNPKQIRELKRAFNIK